MNYLLTTLIFISIDIVSGLLASLKLGRFISSVMRSGLVAKLGEILTVVLGLVAQYYLPIIGISLDCDVVGFLVTYIVIMEIGSIIENIGQVNPDLVAPLSKMFVKLRKDE